MTLNVRQPGIVATLLTLTLALGLATTTVAQEPLTLRINDSEARPGGVLALVVRTYASRQLGQGQVDYFAKEVFGPETMFGVTELLLDPLGAVVFSDQGDAVSRFQVDDTGPTPVATLRFRSPTASVNQSDGPLAVIYFRLPATAMPDTEFEATIDATDSFLLDEFNQPVPIAITAGRVRILAAGDPYGVSADAEATVAGEPVVLSLQTAEVERLSAGQAAFRFKPAFFQGPPQVTIDPRYGNATWVVDDTTPGLVIVTFESADGSLNFVPGDIVTVTFNSRPDIPSGSKTSIQLDPDLTFLTTRRGEDLNLDIESDLLVFP